MMRKGILSGSDVVNRIMRRKGGRRIREESLKEEKDSSKNLITYSK